MNDLISRAWVLAEYDRQHKGPPGGARKIMEEAPTVDAMPVVRCSECKCRFDSIQCNMYSEGMITPDNWFCADGARRDGDT